MIPKRVQPDGFTLIEVMVALLIFTIVAAGLAQTMATAQSTRHTNTLRLEANQLAVSQIEQIRAGRSPISATSGPFAYAATLEAVPRYDDLQRLRVTVRWMDRQPRRLELVTLVRTPLSP